MHQAKHQKIQLAPKRESFIFSNGSFVAFLISFGIQKNFPFMLKKEDVEGERKNSIGNQDEKFFFFDTILQLPSFDILTPPQKSLL